MDSIKKLVGYPMKELVPLITDLLKDGKDVIITARGNSMRPMVKNLRDALILTSYKGNAEVGDVILYKRESGSFVLHRIVDKSEDGSYVLMGDFQLVREEGIKESQILASLSGYIRKGRTVLCSSKRYQRYKNRSTGSKTRRKLYIKLIGLGTYTKAVLKKLFHG